MEIIILKIIIIMKRLFYSNFIKLFIKNLNKIHFKLKSLLN